MKRSEFEEIVYGVVADEGKRLVQRMNELKNEKGKIALDEMCAFIIAELPQTSALVTGKIIEVCGLLAFDPEETQ